MKKHAQLPATLLLLALVFAGCPQGASENNGPIDNWSKPPAGADQPDPNWLLAATPFMLTGENAAVNIKISWPQQAGAARYEVYRDDVLLGSYTGDRMDDYGLVSDQTYSYTVKAFRGKTLLATSTAVSAATFTPPAEKLRRIYENVTGSWTTIIPDGGGSTGPSGYLAADGKWYQYSHATSGSNVIIRVRSSNDGLSNWSGYTTLHTVGNYTDPATGTVHTGAKMEGAVWHTATDSQGRTKVVFTAHREPSGSSYALGHFFLFSIIPGENTFSVYDDRPFGFDSRDQSIFVDNDGRAYVLSSGLGDSYFFLIDRDWTTIENHVNTVFVGSYRETPHVMHIGDLYYFFGSRQNGWYPSQTEYAVATDIGGEWGPLRSVGNRATNGSQFNRIEEYGSERKTYGLWGYRWAANWDGSARETSNIQRLSVLTINGWFSASEYFSQIADYQELGLVGIQAGRNLSLGKPVTASSADVVANNPSRVTDGADMEKDNVSPVAPYFKGGTYPYSLVVDLGTPAVLSEVNLTHRFTGGSDIAYRYIYEGSADGETWTSLVDGSNNFKPCFTTDKITDPAAYRYFRASVHGARNVRNNNSDGNWSEGIIELAIYGTPQ